jgi:pyridoxal phosphate enzyme (YggS family)
MTDLYPTSVDGIAAARAEILTRIAKAAKQAERSDDAIDLVAVSKVQPDERIDAMLATGQRIFGENRVQEAQARWSDRRTAYPDLELRLIGPLQTNKAEDACALFDVIETLDREKLAGALVKAMEKTGRRPSLYVQVNTGDEPQKAGLAVGECVDFVRHCRRDLDLPVEGLMCIPPVEEPAAPHFALLSKLAERAAVTKLSMGMSSDFELGVRLGATSVRVGSALFGERVKR